MTNGTRDFDTVIRKFGFETRVGDHIHAWLDVEGKRVARTRRSLGRGPLAAFNAILRQLHLSKDEFRNAAKCTINRDDYLNLFREQGIL